MEQCAEHVYFQLPNCQNNVEYLFQAATCIDVGLYASMDVINNDDGPRGNLIYFELAAACLLPHDPVVKRKSRKIHNYNHDYASNNSASVCSASASKKTNVGKTWVFLCWNKPGEFSKLSKE